MRYAVNPIPIKILYPIRYKEYFFTAYCLPQDWGVLRIVSLLSIPPKMKRLVMQCVVSFNINEAHMEHKCYIFKLT